MYAICSPCKSFLKKHLESKTKVSLITASMPSTHGSPVTQQIHRHGFHPLGTQAQLNLELNVCQISIIIHRGPRYSPEIQTFLPREEGLPQRQALVKASLLAWEFSLATIFTSQGKILICLGLSCW